LSNSKIGENGKRKAGQPEGESALNVDEIGLITPAGQVRQFFSGSGPGSGKGDIACTLSD
jgi:hypothetical protein